jgi:hypothetical protein
VLNAILGDPPKESLREKPDLTAWEFLEFWQRAIYTLKGLGLKPPVHDSLHFDSFIMNSSTKSKLMIAGAQGNRLA